MLRRVSAIRYAAPLREGGSLPGIMEADDLGTWVVKFRGAGQGAKALVAEVVVGELARSLGLAVPELVTVDLDPELGRTEPDQEIQGLLRASAGLNLGMDYLPGSITYDPLAFPVDPELAARVVWLDAFTLNVDRSWRNPNLLVWGGRLWLIDHGAALYPQHNWATAAGALDRPLPGFADHVLLPALGEEAAERLSAADAQLAAAVTEEVVTAAVDQVPDEWLDEPRSSYVDWLLRRVDGTRPWVEAMLASEELASAGRAQAAAQAAAARAAERRFSGWPAWLFGGSHG